MRNQYGKWAIGGGLCCLGALACTADHAGSDPLSSVTQAAEPGVYHLQALHSGMCLEVVSSSSENGANVQQWTCADADNQKWQLLPRADGSYRLRAEHSRKCLVAHGKPGINGDDIQQGRCRYRRSKWLLLDIPEAGSDVVQLQSRKSELCADVEGSLINDGANVLQWECHTGNNQRYRLIPEGGLGGTGGTGGSGGTGGATGGTAGECDPGTTSSTWASSCQASPADCVAGTWFDPGSTTGDPVQCESTHFVVHSPNGTITAAQCQQAIDTLEDPIWTTYFGHPIYFPEPYCNSSTKYKASIHIRDDYALTGGPWGGAARYMGMWIGPGATGDHWGLAHEFTHGVQGNTGGLADCNPNTCGWMWESHANFMAHQLPEYRSEVHCSEMLVNAPHIYYGSTRDRYCNWQFWEFLKDKYCYSAVNELWTQSAATGERDPFVVLRNNMSWTQEQMNDVFGEWAMHNITWDYQNPPPTSQDNQGPVYRSSYGAITSKSRPERRLRITALEPLDEQWATNRRFMSPYFWAPQRWGYNVVRLYPEAGATEVNVVFRGVTQSGANSGWRWGLVATDAALTTSRYSPLQAGADGELDFCLNSDESLWLVVVGAPTTYQSIYWDQAYPSLYRFPYMVQLHGAWPEGFQNGTQDSCVSGSRHSNGGGCVSGSVPSSVYVGPYAQVLGGTVSGDARIEDHAVVLSGTVSGGTVGALSIISNFSVASSATAQTTFYPLGFFASGQSISGSAWLYGDVEFQGGGVNRSSGSCTGYVDAATCEPGSINDVNSPPPYSWRP